MNDKIILVELQALKNKMSIEKLVYPSLKKEELTEEFLDKFIEIINKTYDANITILDNIIKYLKSKGAEKDGKQN